MSSIGPLRISDVLNRFNDICPNADVAVEEASVPELRRRLQSDDLDALIVNPMDDFEVGYRREPLYTERYVVLLPPAHRYREKNSVTLDDLSGEPYVDRLSCEMREMVRTLCTNRGVELYAKFRSQREDWVQAMVMAGVGFAFVPEYSIVNSHTIQRPLSDPRLERTISLVTLAGRRFSPALAVFVRAALMQRSGYHPPGVDGGSEMAVNVRPPGPSQ